MQIILGEKNPTKAHTGFAMAFTTQKINKIKLCPLLFKK